MVLNAIENASPTECYKYLHSSGSSYTYCPNIGDGRFCFWKYRDLQFALKNEEVFSSEGIITSFTDSCPKEQADQLSSMKGWVLYSEGDAHRQKKLRILQSQRQLDEHTFHLQLQKSITNLCHSILSQNSYDLTNDFASKVALQAFCHMIGISTSHATFLNLISKKIILFAEPNLTPNEINIISDGYREGIEFFKDIISEHSYHQNSYFVKMESEFQSEKMNQDLPATLISLLLGAHENVSNLISICIYRLINSDIIRSEVFKDQKNMHIFIEEILRYDSPSKITARVTLKECKLAGGTIPKAAKCLFLIGASGRDPDIFTNPNTFSIEPRSEYSLAFGYGRHACTGARLTISTCSLAINCFFSYCFRNLKKFEEPKWKFSRVFNGIDNLRCSNICAII